MENDIEDSLQMPPDAPTRVAHATKATIAARLNLSRATVTGVLNGRAAELRISEATQQRVLELARELGYRPNLAARAVRTGRYGNIALIQSELGQYLPPQLLSGVAHAIADKDMHLVVIQVPDVAIEEETFLPHTVHELSVDGVLINRHRGFSSTLLDRIHALRIPAIFLNVKRDVDCVYPDDRLGAQLATEYLLNLGHKRITYVDTEFSGKTHYSKPDRQAGYEQAMSAGGRPSAVHLLPRSWLGSEATGEDQRVHSARQLLQRKDRPTAILAYELGESMAVVHAAFSLGIRIPQDLSIIHFHHQVDERYFIPMHTVSNVMREVGSAAISMLMEKIENPERVLPARIIPEELLEGASCMPPPA